MTRPALTRIRHGMGSWLSLFAMLMVLIGPLIGQGAHMLHQHGGAHGMGHGSDQETSHDMAHGMSMPMPMPDELCGELPATPRDTHHDWALWDACGYCSLLFQHPALVETQALFLRLPPPPGSLTPTLFTSLSATAPTFPGARPRAPPLSIV